jgi:hypothetical protein
VEDGVSKWKGAGGEKPQKGGKMRGYGLFHFETDRQIRLWREPETLRLSSLVPKLHLGTRTKFQDIIDSAFYLISPLDSGKFATKGPFCYSDHIGSSLEIKELPNNGKPSAIPHTI